LAAHATTMPSIAAHGMPTQQPRLLPALLLLLGLLTFRNLAFSTTLVTQCDSTKGSAGLPNLLLQCVMHSDRTCVPRTACMHLLDLTPRFN